MKNTKKLTAILLTMAMLISILTMFASAASTVDSGSIGGGLLPACGQYLRKVLAPCRAAVITDSTVAPLYLEPVRQSLLAAGFTVSTYVFPAGEAHKNFETLAGILEFLAEAHLTRTDCVAALPEFNEQLRSEEHTSELQSQPKSRMPSSA